MMMITEIRNAGSIGRKRKMTNYQILNSNDDKMIVSLIKDYTRLKKACHNLSMICLQSDRYLKDPEFRDCVDNCLLLTMEK